ncbi:MAG: hypothetical protein J07HQW2_00102 [Haloquadratum walsbyi J07HQW2]|uniref:Uncharacterized protein n=1 Tax=Haloquadratum walsbyi J07HQW2 TaxID=1238425 RepID=U1MTQ4_9EURY|nr:MAG: hypothetical protein J07HQW2_00102 [Haloquadratum walsbyi J07HQW2]
MTESAIGPSRDCVKTGRGEPDRMDARRDAALLDLLRKRSRPPPDLETLEVRGELRHEHAEEDGLNGEARLLVCTRLIQVFSRPVCARYRTRTLWSDCGRVA